MPFLLEFHIKQNSFGNRLLQVLKQPACYNLQAPMSIPYGENANQHLIQYINIFKVPP